MVALTARMQHERNYGDDQLAKLSKMRRLDVDPTRVEMGMGPGLLRAGAAQHR